TAPEADRDSADTRRKTGRAADEAPDRSAERHVTRADTAPEADRDSADTRRKTGRAADEAPDRSAERHVARADTEPEAERSSPRGHDGRDSAGTVLGRGARRRVTEPGPESEADRDSAEAIPSVGDAAQAPGRSAGRFVAWSNGGSESGWESGEVLGRIMRRRVVGADARPRPGRGSAGAVRDVGGAADVPGSGVVWVGLSPGPDSGSAAVSPGRDDAAAPGPGADSGSASVPEGRDCAAEVPGSGPESGTDDAAKAPGRAAGGDAGSGRGRGRGRRRAGRGKPAARQVPGAASAAVPGDVGGESAVDGALPPSSAADDPTRDGEPVSPVPVDTAASGAGWVRVEVAASVAAPTRAGAAARHRRRAVRGGGLARGARVGGGRSADAGKPSAAPRRRHSAGPYGGGLRAGQALLVGLLRERREPLLHVLGWSVAEGVPALLSGALLAAALDRGFLAGRLGVGFVLLGVLALAMLIRAAATYAMFPHLAAVVEPIRDTLVRRVVSEAVLDATSGRPDAGRHAAAAVARLTEQVESCRNLTASLLRTLRQLGVTIVAALLGLAVLAPLLLPLVLIPLGLAAWLFVRLLPPLARRRRALVLADEEIATRTGRTVAGLRDVIACGAQDRVVAELGAAADAQARAAKLLARASSVRLLVVALGGHLPLLAVLLAAPWLVRQGTLSTGEVAGAALYLAQHLEPAVRAATATVGGWFLELLVVAGRLARTGGAAPAPVPAARTAADAADPDDFVPGAPFALVLDRVTFGYGPYAEPVVRDLSMTVPPGSHLAVVGPSGIGKSTLAALLAGLLPPDQGTVSLAGRPGAAIGRGTIAVVPQEAYVFAGSVHENLSYLDPDVTRAALDRAVRLVGAAELVARLGGYHAHLADPGTLSAGERQLIALARTYLSPARLVILDEATCHLDPPTEALAEAAFATRAGALVVIAHRIDSARRADRVLLMDGNRPILGTHHELLAESPLYRDLVGAWEHRPGDPADWFERKPARVEEDAPDRV
ncbi:ATP-binding cassette domain-containing protein, partial [Embleya sp. NPDC005971]|uniref:ATP-binding cassette domain-containing protein n=1 Tax=Embleya sp. NPDC005971 TaxID=3156724 RepID=UPI0033FBABD9